MLVINIIFGQNTRPIYYLQVFLTIPGEASAYTVRCKMNTKPTSTEFDVEAHITDVMNETANTINASLSYDNNTGTQTTSNATGT